MDRLHVHTSARTYIAARRFRRCGGFTFLELVLVVVILGILFSVSVMSVRNLTPKYRVRTAARELGTTIEQARLLAVSRGEWTGIRYVLDPPSSSGNPEPPPYYQLIPPPRAEFPDQPLHERKPHSKQELPSGVSFRAIRFAGNHTVDSDTATVVFSPMGNAGSHIVVFEGPGGRVMSLKANCITGLIDFYETDDVIFRNFEE